MALWVVFRKIDTSETLRVLSGISSVHLFAALVLFNVSKIISSFRLERFYHLAGLTLGRIENLRLYYVGMYYNLFLPGGIGGDGYKVYLLNKKYKTPVKELIKASLLDRLSGLIALLFLGILFAFFPDNQGFFNTYSLSFLPWIGAILLYPLWYLANRFFFKNYLSGIVYTDVQSLGVQLFQIVCAIALLYGLGVEVSLPSYLFLFLVSSVVAVLPITIGGVGARELVFVLGYEFLPIEQNQAVAFSLLFFLVTAFSSLIGALIRVD